MTLQKVIVKRLLLSICLLVTPYIIDGNSPLASAQETEPLTLVNHLGGEANAVFVTGNYVYVGFGPELAVLDISNPTQPVRTGYLLLPDTVRDIQVVGGYAYAVTGQAGLHLVDVSAPTMPTLVSTFTPPGEGREVAIANHYAYLETIKRFDGQEFVGGGVRAIDISNPTAPREVAFFPSIEDEYYYVSIAHTSVPDKAYIFEGGWKHGHTILDVSNPVTPVESVSTDGISEYGHSAILTDHLAYVFSRQGMQITDLSGPSPPTQLALFSHWGSIAKTIIANDMAYLVVSEFIRVSGNVWLVDVSNSARPTLTGNYFVSGQARDIAVADNYLYVAAGSSGLRVVDISSPDVPVEIAAYLPMVAMYNMTSAADNTAYAYTQTDSQWGLQQIDLAEPVQPVQMGFYPLSYPYGTFPYSSAYLAASSSIAIQDDYLRLIRHIHHGDDFIERRLQILNLASNSSFEVGNYSLPGSGLSEGGQIAGDYAYIPAGDLGLRILDISDSASPQEVGGFFNPAPPQDAPFNEEVFGDYVVRIAAPQYALEDILLVYKNDRLIYIQRGEHLGIAGAYQRKDPLAPLGRDITGNGIPNMVIKEYTGGAHCCSFTYIFELSDVFRLVAVIPTTHSDGNFAHLDDDDIPEFVFNDWHFAYWATSFAGSPSPEMILRYQDGTYRPAIDLLRQPAPEWAELEEQAQRMRKSFWESGGLPELLETMLDLIYSGHADLAWKFLDAAWPSEFAGKDEFLIAFLHKLSANIYWPELQTLNTGQWPPPFNTPAGESRIAPFSHTPTENISIAKDDDLAGPVNVVAVQDNYAYIGLGTGLVVLDISDPLMPRRIGYLSLHYPLKDIVAAGPYLYLAEKSDPSNANDSTFLRVVDIANPTAPVEVGSYEIAEGNISRLTLNGRYLGLIAENIWNIPDQLEILDISIPEAPLQVAVYPMPKGAGGASLTGWIGDYIYVTLSEGGVFVLQFIPSN
jgi:hypothetical protein